MILKIKNKIMAGTSNHNVLGVAKHQTVYVPGIPQLTRLYTTRYSAGVLKTVFARMCTATLIVRKKDTMEENVVMKLCTSHIVEWYPVYVVSPTSATCGTMMK